MSSPSPVTHSAPARPITGWLGLAIGAGAAVLGLLPWLVTGMRLPLQNLWEGNASPTEMPLGLLPFSQYAVTTIAGIIVVGAAIAGIVARSIRRRSGRRAFVAITSGLVAVQLVAILQTTLVVGAGLRPGRESTIYLAALVAVAVASFAIGIVVFLLVARMPRAGALVGLSIASVASVWWAGSLIAPNVVVVSEVHMAMLGLLVWVPAILCGTAIAWCGIDSAGRIVAAVIAVAAVVIGPALGTAVTVAAGSRVLLQYPAELLEYGLQVFQSVLGTVELTLRAIVTAVVVAAVGLALKAALRRRRDSRMRRGDGAETKVSA